MRCVDCKVDLEDNHKNCPLCGNKAIVSKQQIVLLTAPYPKQIVELKNKD